MFIIGVAGLRKVFKDITAVNIFVFLGRNGAGKSTTIRTLLTLICPTAGKNTLLKKGNANSHIRNPLAAPHLIRLCLPF